MVAGDELNLAVLSAADYESVLALWRQAGLHIRPAGRDSAEQFARQLAGGTQTVIGLRAAGALVGVAVVTHDGRKGWINRLAVHPAFRRCGVGKRLIVEAERLLRAQGIGIIAALIEDWNAPSMALFQGAGYTVYPDIHYLIKRDDDEV
ncbi:MAG: GNAT family N-acetyltransferase [Anaerolineae bacterium]|nr:GNAT family N-acetyltransferase [Anaerolineae bacterium]